MSRVALLPIVAVAACSSEVPPCARELRQLQLEQVRVHVVGAWTNADGTDRVLGAPSCMDHVPPDDFTVELGEQFLFTKSDHHEGCGVAVCETTAFGPAFTGRQSSLTLPFGPNWSANGYAQKLAVAPPLCEAVISEDVGPASGCTSATKYALLHFDVSQSLLAPHDPARNPAALLVVAREVTPDFDSTCMNSRVPAASCADTYIVELEAP